jgi:excisionase family DNA binding protein
MVRPDLTNGMPLLMTVEEAAELLRLGRTRMYELVMSGRIVSVKVGRRRLIPRKSLEEFVESLINDQVPV